MKRTELKRGDKPLTAKTPIRQRAKNRGRKGNAVSSPMRSAANGAECTLQIPGVCNHDPETVVACHLRLFGMAGMGQKPDDLFVVDACAACHAILDHRGKWADAALGWDDVLRALMVTQMRRRESGLVILEGEK